MNKKTLLYLCIFLVVAAAAAGAVFYYNNLRGVWPAISSPSEDITTLINASEPLTSNTNTSANTNAGTQIPESVNETDIPLTLAPGFSISIFAQDLPGVRVLEEDPQGNLWVSQSGSGTVSLLEVENGVVTNVSTPFRGLQNPHGLAFDPTDPFLLYIAETNKISRTHVYTEEPLQKIVDLPNNGGHNKRSIVFGPDGRLYVGLGSSCNVCRESDERLATVYSLNPDGSDFKEVADGLRNASFLAIHPNTQALWATGNQRDLIGDNIPPDEVNIVQQGNFYGWPFCYGQNIHDTTFDNSAAAQARCESATPPHIEIQAHSAPLGLGFVPDSAAWPDAYHADLIVAYHGSWNRTTPTGYKLVRMVLEDDGSYVETQDFVSGWLQNGSALGRPVDVEFADSGVLYVSDDKAGVIYRITYGN